MSAEVSMPPPATSLHSATPVSSSESLPAASSATTTTIVSGGPSTTTTTPTVLSSAPKYVVAHVIVGNTYPYTVDNWKSDILLAHANGIDGFALNVGSDSWQPQRVADAYSAAAQSSTGFKLFLSFDMSAMPCSSSEDASVLRNYITTYASHPNQLIYNDRVFASTFSGESCTFGQGSVPSGWSTQFTQHPDLTGSNAVYFVPSFFVNPNQFNTFGDVMDGDFNWNSGWPIQVSTSFATSLLKPLGAALSSLSSKATTALAQFVGSNSSDSEYLSALATMGGQNRTYMAAVSPWFFTHYSPQTYDKNFIYLSDDHLYSKRWESLVAMRDQVDIVQIVTWNDYGESHYIGPIEGAQPNSQGWVDGLDHTGWLNMTSYYSSAFKTGSYPAVTKDQLYLWSRTHPVNADAPDPVGRPSNYQLTQDKLWAVVMATAPSTVILSTSSTNSQTFSVPEGVSKLSLPIEAGGIMHGTITRNGQTVVDLQPSNFTFNPNPPSYNFNAFVAYSA
ncbi:glycoside hydrolase family 71 protein [Serpula lacrymans var. lacrymans S7.3]|uniref:Glycoside hydrolase family 71 protein n=2 Tax=Serpula lacrymans var. lacrymans TaxID=341189 RepID=F8PZS2_SERL3|nr:glycoside hydrolase family 71 protein [Serpula lacrymans var. lacrymans S7.9]EGN98394.1 glycoside hydrolase family 71 protein [Serpula lacrymans var. lacrymans S7.3]EGO23946.1 glycoside hydrolase family 71 protein [Serpula lacrymans var. lacrymans S7.9]